MDSQPKPKKSNTSSDLIENLETNVLRKQVDQMTSDNLTLMSKIQELSLLLDKKQLEINHLLELVSHSSPLLLNNVAPLTDEEIIAQKQLEKLLVKARDSELTLEDVKKFDLLVKNKRLAQGSSTFNADFVKLPQNASKRDLTKIASMKTQSEQIQSDDE